MKKEIGPSIEVESANGVREVLLTTHHLMKRVIFLDGEIDEVMANEFLSQMLYLREDPTKPVNIYINSSGGEINSGMVIYDIIRGCDMKLNIICTGKASSMAAVILAGGQAGRRYIYEHSRVMIHEPLISGGVGGSATSIKRIADSIIETRGMVNELIAKHTGKSIEEIDEATSFDNYMNASEAVEFGLCDKVITKLNIADEYI